MKPESLPSILRDWTLTASTEELRSLHDRVERWRSTSGRTVALGILESLIRERTGEE